MAATWALLIHQLPPEPLYLRAKILRRLGKAGAVALKNGVYVLPDEPESRASLEAIADEAVAGGGEAHVCRASFLHERTNGEIVALFRAQRKEDYETLVANVRGWIPRLPTESSRQRAVRVARARRRLEEISRIDFFPPAGREQVETLLDGLVEAATRPGTEPAARSSGAVWVTRRGVQVDRIASAWLIRRFLDAGAQFRFVDPSEPPRRGERRFDIVPGDFTHRGDRCTFETLLEIPGLAEPALVPLAEIVHELDLKDGKFARSEAAGIGRLLAGVVAGEPTDEGRLERGFALFDDLYRSFSGRRPASRGEVRV